MRIEPCWPEYVDVVQFSQIDNNKLEHFATSFVLKSFQLTSTGKLIVDRGDNNRGLKESDFEKLANLLEKKAFDNLVDFELHADNLSFDYFNKKLAL